jgi:hypothetical protein
MGLSRADPAGRSAHRGPAGSSKCVTMPWGKALLALVLSHPFAVGSGCSAPTGELGGPCESDGCGGTCDFGLRCDALTNTCVVDTVFLGASSSPSVAGSSPDTCTNASLDECPTRQLAFVCGGQTKPTGADFVSCEQKSSGAGTTLYCCTPSWLDPPLPPTFGSGDSGSAQPGSCCEDAGSDGASTAESDGTSLDATDDPALLRR